jgi:hypothetical protein
MRNVDCERMRPGELTSDVSGGVDVDIGYPDLRAFCGETFTRGAADSGGTAGDEGNAALEPACQNGLLFTELADTDLARRSRGVAADCPP